MELGFMLRRGDIFLSAVSTRRPGTFTLNCFLPVEEKNGEGFTDMLLI